MAWSKADKPSKAWAIESIQIGRRKRAVDNAAVTQLMESMGRLGLLSPIVLRTGHTEVEGEVIKNVPILVAGRQRLEAARRLKWFTIDGVMLDCDELDGTLIEISENLHRAELTVQERADQTDEWVRLEGKKHKSGVSAQLGQKPKRARRGGRPQAGISAAARQLGLTRQEIQRAQKIAAITPEAKAAAKKAGLDDNQSKLLQIASAAPQEQVERIIELSQAQKPKPVIESTTTLAPPVADGWDIPTFLERRPVERTAKLIVQLHDELSRLEGNDRIAVCAKAVELLGPKITRSDFAKCHAIMETGIVKILVEADAPVLKGVA